MHIHDQDQWESRFVLLSVWRFPIFSFAISLIVGELNDSHFRRYIDFSQKFATQYSSKATIFNLFFTSSLPKILFCIGGGV